MAVLKPLTEEVISCLRTGVTATCMTQCVEELVLNSVDAGAKCIAVRVDFSCWKIQVVDNGSGIPVDQLEHVAERYNTSKCHLVEDLENLRYFGYRGEALSSIRDASSVLEIVTKTGNYTQTFCRLFRKGIALKVAESKTCRPSPGTTITAYDLFYNLPVRRKCVNIGLEFERIRQRVEGIALINPQISFSLRNDITGNVVIQTHKSSNTLGAFTYLFGLNKARFLSEVGTTWEQFEINGYISKEGYCKKDLQFVYINGRLVLKTKIHKIINRILGKYCFGRKKYVQESPGIRDTSSPSASSPSKHTEKHAVFVVNIKCPFNSYDITFDPAKTVVEFKDWETLVSRIESLVKDFLKKEGIIIAIDSNSKVDITIGNRDTDQKDDSSDLQLVHEDEIILLSDEQKYAKSISSFDVANSLVSKTAHRPSNRVDYPSPKNTSLSMECYHEENVTDPGVQLPTKVVKCSSSSPVQDAYNEQQDAIVDDTAAVVHSRDDSDCCRSNLSCIKKSDLMVTEGVTECASIPDHIKYPENVSGHEINESEGDVLEMKKSLDCKTLDLQSCSSDLVSVISETSSSDASAFPLDQTLSTDNICPMECSTPVSDNKKRNPNQFSSNFTESFSSVESATSFLSEDPLHISPDSDYRMGELNQSKQGNSTTNEYTGVDSGIGDESFGYQNTSYNGKVSGPIRLLQEETSILSQFRKRKYEDDLKFTRNSKDCISRRLNEIHGGVTAVDPAFKKPSIFNITKPQGPCLKTNQIPNSGISSCECLRRVKNTNNYDSAKNDARDNCSIPTAVTSNVRELSKHCDSHQKSSVSDYSNSGVSCVNSPNMNVAASTMHSVCNSSRNRIGKGSSESTRNERTSNNLKEFHYHKLFPNRSDYNIPCTSKERNSYTELQHQSKKEQLTDVLGCNKHYSSVILSNYVDTEVSEQNGGAMVKVGKISPNPQILTTAAKLAKRMRGGKADPAQLQKSSEVMTSASFIQTPSSVLKHTEPSGRNDIVLDVSGADVKSNEQKNILKNTLPLAEEIKKNSILCKASEEGMQQNEDMCIHEMNAHSPVLLHAIPKEDINLDCSGVCNIAMEPNSVGRKHENLLSNHSTDEVQPCSPPDQSQLSAANINEFTLIKTVCTDSNHSTLTDFNISSPTVSGYISLTPVGACYSLQSISPICRPQSDNVEASTLFSAHFSTNHPPNIEAKLNSDLLSKGTVANKSVCSSEVLSEKAKQNEETQQFMAASQGFQVCGQDKYDMSSEQGESGSEFNESSGKLMETGTSLFSRQEILQECNHEENPIEILRNYSEVLSTTCSDKPPSSSSVSTAHTDSEQGTTEMFVNNNLLHTTEIQNEQILPLADSAGNHNNTRQHSDEIISCFSDTNDKFTRDIITTDSEYPHNGIDSSGMNVCSIEKSCDTAVNSGDKSDLWDSSFDMENLDDVPTSSPGDNNWVKMKDPKTGEVLYIHKQSGHSIPVESWSTITVDESECKEDIQPFQQLSKSFKSTFSHLSGKILKCGTVPSQASNSTFRSLLGSGNTELLDDSVLQTNSRDISSTNGDLPLSVNLKENEGEAADTSGETIMDSSENDSSTENTRKACVGFCTPETLVQDYEDSTAAKIIDSWQNPVFNKPEQAITSATDTCENTKQMEKTLRSMRPITFTKDMLQTVKVVGQIDNKFIACILHLNSTKSSAGVLVFIDQHAAHERIRLESLTKDSFIKGSDNRSLKSSEVVPPELLCLPTEQVRVMNSYKEEFHRIGLNFKERDHQTIELLSIPATVAMREASDFKHKRESVVIETLQALIAEHVEVLMSTHGARQLLPKTIHRILCSRACRGAIKFGDKLSIRECEEMIQALSKCELPFQCAHGRPSLIPILELKKLDDKRMTKSRSTPRLWKLKCS